MKAFEALPVSRRPAAIHKPKTVTADLFRQSPFFCCHRFKKPERRGEPGGRTSALERPFHNSADKVFLHAEENDQQRNQRQNDRCRQRTVLPGGRLVTQEGDADRQRLRPCGGGEGSAVGKFTPYIDEGEDDHGSDAGLYNRQHDLGKNLPVVAAVDGGCLAQRIWNAVELAAHDKHGHGQIGRDVRQNQPPCGVDQIHFGLHDINRDQIDHIRQRQNKQNKAQVNIFEPKVHLGERVTHGSAENDRGQHAPQRNDHRVSEILEKITHLGDHLDVVPEGDFCGEDRQRGRVDFIVGFQRGEKRPQKRNDENKRRDQQKNEEDEIDRQIFFFHTFTFFIFASSPLLRNMLNIDNSKMTTPMK